MVKKVGEEIRRLREARGLKAKDVAGRAKIPPGFLSRIETGKVGWSEETLEKIANAMNVPLAAFFGNDARITEVTDIGRNVPLVDAITAALWSDATLQRVLSQTHQQYVSCTLDVSMSALALPISGVAMEPDFRPGDIVIIDPQQHPSPGDFIAASVNEGPAQIAKYRLVSTAADRNAVFELVPINSFFPTQRSDQNHIRIIGRCIERRTAL